MSIVDWSTPDGTWLPKTISARVVSSVQLKRSKIKYSQATSGAVWPLLPEIPSSGKHAWARRREPSPVTSTVTPSPLFQALKFARKIMNRHYDLLGVAEDCIEHFAIADDCTKSVRLEVRRLKLIWDDEPWNQGGVERPKRCFRLASGFSLANKVRYNTIQRNFT
jgi:hypothetical protein